LVKPEREDILKLIEKNAKFSQNHIVEYIALNDPTFFYRSPYLESPDLGFNYLINDQKLVMIVLRSAAERGSD